MLFADKRALETNLQACARPSAALGSPRAGLCGPTASPLLHPRPQVSLLKIREKELQFYTQNCIAIGTQAALLSGFAYNGIIQVDIPSDSSDWLKTLYLTVTTAAMGFELIAVLNSTLEENEATIKQQTPAKLDETIMALDSAQHSLGIVYLL